jgi:competence protein ComEC
MSASKVLFYLSLSIITGIGLASFITIPQALIWGFLIGGVVLIASTVVAQRIPIFKFGAVAGFCLLCVAVGAARYGVIQSVIDHDPVRLLNDKPQKIALTGIIVDEPDIRDNFQKLKVKVNHTKSIVLVSTSRHPDYHYLDEVTVAGKLKTPAVSDDFNYKNYLLKDGIYSVMDFPTIEIISQKHRYDLFSWTYEKVLWLKGHLRASIHQNFQKTQGLVLEGILLGENKNMPPDMRDKLNAAGLRYLTAISGVHIIIMSTIIFMVLLALGLWRRQAFYGAFIFIWLYVIGTGMSASGVRAAIMGSLFLIAQQVGRQYANSRTITLAAVVMLLANPFLVRYDVGFQLSFLASLGIIHAKPLFDTMLYRIKHVFREKPRTKAGVFSKKAFITVLDMLAVTLAAQLFTLPIMVYNFGLISLVAPLSSLLILPVMPWLIGLGLACALLGIISPFLAWILYFPTAVFLLYFFAIVSIFSQPWMTLAFPNISWIWLIFYYIMLASTMLFWWKKKSEKIFEY